MKPVSQSINYYRDTDQGSITAINTDGTVQFLVTGRSIPYDKVTVVDQHKSKPTVGQKTTLYFSERDRQLPYIKAGRARVLLNNNNFVSADWPIWGQNYLRTYFNDMTSIPSFTITWPPSKEIVTLTSSDYFERARIASDIIVIFCSGGFLYLGKVAISEGSPLILSDYKTIATATIDLIIDDGNAYFSISRTSPSRVEIVKINISDLGIYSDWTNTSFNQYSGYLISNNSYLYNFLWTIQYFGGNVCICFTSTNRVGKVTGSIIDTINYVYSADNIYINGQYNFFRSITYATPYYTNPYIIWCKDNKVMPLIYHVGTGLYSKQQMFDIDIGSILWTLDSGERIDDYKTTWESTFWRITTPPHTELHGNTYTVYDDNHLEQIVKTPLATNGDIIVIGISRTLVESTGITINNCDTWIENIWPLAIPPNLGYDEPGVEIGPDFPGGIGSFNDFPLHEAWFNVYSNVWDAFDIDSSLDYKAVTKKESMLSCINYDTGVEVVAPIYISDIITENTYAISDLCNFSGVKTFFFETDPENYLVLEYKELIGAPASLEERFGLASNQNFFPYEKLGVPMYPYVMNCPLITWRNIGGKTECYGNSETLPSWFEEEGVWKIQCNYAQWWGWALIYTGPLTYTQRVRLEEFTTNYSAMNTVITDDKVIFFPQVIASDRYIEAFNLSDLSLSWRMQLADDGCNIKNTMAHNEHLFCRVLIVGSGEPPDSKIYIIDINTGTILHTYNESNQKMSSTLSNYAFPMMTNKAGKLIFPSTSIVNKYNSIRLLE